MKYKPFPAYKESGVPWLGQIPEHWSSWRFSHVIEVNGGQVDPRQPPWSEMTLIAPNHIESGTGRLLFTQTAAEQGADSGKYRIQKGQVIYSKIRPALRKATLAPEDCLSSADMYGLRPISGLLRDRFLLEVILSKPFTEFALDASMRVAMPKINRDALGAGTVWFPSLDEQDAILAFLDREIAQIDELIAKQKDLIELLGERRKAVITRAITKGLDPSVPMRDAGVAWLGRVPAHWIVTTVKQRFSVMLGKMLDARRTVRTDNQEFLYLRAANIQDHGLLLDDVNTMPFTILEQRALRLRAGDLLVVEGGAVGTNYVLPADMEDWFFQKTVNRVRSLRGDSTVLLGHLIRTYRDTGVIDMICNKSTIAHLTSEKLEMLPIAVAPIDEQRQIEVYLDTQTTRIDELIDKSNASVALLRERRSALITAAVTGKIDVRGAV